MGERKGKKPGSSGSQLAIASEKNTIREKDNDGTFAAQPRTFAATSALPISTEVRINKSRADEKAPGIDIA